MADTDYVKIAIEVAIGLGGGFLGALGTAWKMGRASAQDRANLKEEVLKRIEDVKKDIDAEFKSLRRDTDQKMDTTMNAADERNDLLITQFRESFEGLRRQLDDQKLHVETTFFRKVDMSEFVKTNREDMKSINDKLDRILAAKFR